MKVLAEGSIACAFVHWQITKRRANTCRTEEALTRSNDIAVFASPDVLRERWPNRKVNETSRSLENTQQDPAEMLAPFKHVLHHFEAPGRQVAIYVLESQKQDYHPKNSVTKTESETFQWSVKLFS